MNVINAYVDGRMSYRGLSLNSLGGNKVSSATAYRWVKAAAHQCKSPLEASTELQPVWGGSLQLDAFHVSVEGCARWAFLTLDSETQDIPHARVLRNERDPRRIAKMCIELRDVLHYRPKIIVVDGNPSVLKAVRSIYPSVPIQLCVWHKEQTINKILPNRKINANQRELKVKIHEFLCANTLNEADTAYQFLIENSLIWPEKKSQNAIISLNRDRESLLAHFYVDAKFGLTEEKRAPRTTSVTEGTISRFRLKLHQVHGFKSFENLPGLLNLLFMHHRAVPFRSGRDKRSPLQRAQRPVDNWLLFSQRKSNNETDRQV
jgi:transposase-like protein